MNSLPGSKKIRLQPHATRVPRVGHSCSSLLGQPDNCQLDNCQVDNC